MAATVTAVTVRIDDGREITIRGDRPVGDNPRFYSAQIEKQLAEIAKVFRDAMYGMYDYQSDKDY